MTHEPPDSPAAGRDRAVGHCGPDDLLALRMLRYDIARQTVKHTGLPLVGLHGSLLLREAASVLTWQPGRMWGGMLNMTAIVLFAGAMVFSVAASFRRGLSTKPPA